MSNHSGQLPVIVEDLPHPPSQQQQQVRVMRQINLNLPSEVPTLLNPNDILTQRVYDSLLKFTTGKPLTTTNIVELVGFAVRTVQNLKRNGTQPLTNEEKRSIVMVAIQRLIRELPMDEELRVYFNDVFIPIMLGGVIDSLCSLQVNVADVKKCFPCCG